MKFRLEGLDPSGVRIGTAKFSDSDISFLSTPTPILTSTELNDANKLIASGLGDFSAGIKMPHKMLEIAAFFNKQGIAKLRNNEISMSRKRQIEKLTQLGFVTSFRPVIARDVKIDDSLNKILLEMQIQAGIDFIHIPDSRYDSTPKDYEKRITTSRDYIDDTKEIKQLEAVPALRMDIPAEIFEQKINSIMDNSFNRVDLISSSYYNARHNYHHIRKISKDAEIWIHLSGIGKIWSGNKKSSLMHILMPFGFDSYSLKSSYFPMNRPFRVIPKLARRFDNRTWGIIDVEEHEKTWGKSLNCNCPVDVGRNLKSMLDTFRNIGNENLIPAANKVHDAYDSYNEFEKARKAALNNEFIKYVRPKKYAEEPLAKMLKIDVHQRSILDL